MTGVAVGGAALAGPCAAPAQAQAAPTPAEALPQCRGGVRARVARAWLGSGVRLPFVVRGASAGASTLGSPDLVRGVKFAHDPDRIATPFCAWLYSLIAACTSILKRASSI